jgi:hypothetical protein
MRSGTSRETVGRKRRKTQASRRGRRDHGVVFHVDRLLFAMGNKQFVGQGHSTPAFATMSASVKGCALTCLQNATCQAWDFHHRGFVGGMRIGTCSLKASTGTPTPFGALHSGERTPPACAPGTSGTCIMGKLTVTSAQSKQARVVLPLGSRISPG